MIAERENNLSKKGKHPLPNEKLIFRSDQPFLDKLLFNVFLAVLRLYALREHVYKQKIWYRNDSWIGVQLYL